MLPTAPGHALLGQSAEGRGQTDLALQHYQVAATSNSPIGKDAMARAARLDFPRNPNKYMQSGVLADNRGNLYAVVQNNAAVAIENVRVRVVRYDAKTGRPVSKSGSMAIRGLIEAGKRGQVGIGVRVNDPQQTRLYKVVVEQAQLAEDSPSQTN